MVISTFQTSNEVKDFITTFESHADLISPAYVALSEEHEPTSFKEACLLQWNRRWSPCIKTKLQILFNYQKRGKLLNVTGFTSRRTQRAI